MGYADSTVNQMKNISWNGIRFLRPDTWQPVTIDKKRLLLAEDGRQVMEIKWGSGADDNPQSYIKKLSAAFKKQLDCSVTQSEIPASWQQAIQKFKTDNFSWKSSNGIVQGLVLQCSHCNTITLMQFFPPFNPSLITEILNSFVDHNCEHWAIFDIKFQIPEPYTINNYSFAAGRFELLFRIGKRKEQITFKRLAPAQQLLQGKDLAQIALEIMEVDTTTSANGNEVFWEDAPRSFLALLGKRLRREVLYRSGKMWLDKVNNKILAVELASMRPIEREKLSSINRDFIITKH